MIGLEDLLPAHLLERFALAPSVLCVSTAQPKYLVFGSEPTHPLLVVQTGTGEALSRVFDVTTRLHQALPGRVPEPLELKLRSGDRSVLVQSGLAGQPWFTLQQRIATVDDWTRIKDLSLDALERLHTVSAAQADWIERTPLADVHDAIRRRHAELEGGEDARLGKLLDEHRARLTGVDDVALFRQHGDFCVNNLLFRDDDAGIIDFEQFGRVTLPLHDEFMIAGSLLALYPAVTDAGVATGLWQELETRGVHGESLFAKPVVEALFVLHLLWWIAETHDHGLREPRALRYRAALEHTLASSSAKPSWAPERTLL